MEANITPVLTTESKHIQVAVTVSKEDGANALTIDPWSNCPSADAREEGRCCNDCQFWGGEVEAIDWSEFSLCEFADGGH